MPWPPIPASLSCPFSGSGPDLLHLLHLFHLLHFLVFSEVVASCSLHAASSAASSAASTAASTAASSAAKSEAFHACARLEEGSPGAHVRAYIRMKRFARNCQDLLGAEACYQPNTNGIGRLD